MSTLGSQFLGRKECGRVGRILKPNQLKEQTWEASLQVHCLVYQCITSTALSHSAAKQGWHHNLQVSVLDEDVSEAPWQKVWKKSQDMRKECFPRTSSF
jgi:hypothetical protein